MFINKTSFFARMDIKEARKKLQPLLDRYKKHENDKAFLRNEKQVCQSLLVPFIRDVLGWDTEDPSEFKAEESKAGKRIDYVVYNDGISQFIVEAKAPSKDIYGNEAYYKQALEYGYGKDHDLAILTNFRQIVVLAPKIRYRLPEEAEILRIDLLTASDEDIETVLMFQKEFWVTTRRDNPLYKKIIHHKKQIPVDERLLDDMKNWRVGLLKNIKKRNIKLDFNDEKQFRHIEDEVQKFIDRLIFICFCEDKELNEPELKSLMEQKKDRWAMKPGWLLEQIQKVFEDFRKEYDSDLFDTSLANKFIIDDVELLRVLQDLRQPSGKPTYDFKSIEADILGRTYENFIGHIQSGKKIKEELEDRGKRKTEGVYYTPKYIVDYIVNNTVRKIASGKSFDNILKIKIVDPACGSGSFLIRAFDVLVEEVTKSKKRMLNYSEKKELMLSCIHGVDVDERAVEIAKLNLSLRLAEKGKKLPVLRDNIRNGNSLIDDPSIVGYRAFDWKEEFSELFDNGGFDVVLGNPPYVRPHNLNQKDKEFFWKHLKTFRAKSDLYNCFMEKSITLLNKNGLFSFIVPHTWTSLESFFEIRKFILDNCKIVKLVQLPKKVFKDAVVETCIFVFCEEKNEKKRGQNKVLVEKLNKESDVKFVKEFEQSEVKQNHLLNFGLYSDTSSGLLQKIKKKGHRLGEYIDFFYGLKTADDDKFIFNSPKNNECKILLRSKDITRYSKNFKGKYVWYKPDLMKKNKKTARPGDKERFETEKIIVARMGKEIVVTYDDQNYYVKDGMLLLKKDKTTNLKFLSGILNSKIISYYYKNYFITIDVLKNALLELPIVVPTKSKMDKIAMLVKQIEATNTRLLEIKDKSTYEKQKLEKNIQKLDKQIDQEIYKLYGITKEEQAIIELSI
ncbi:Eco57I restriction-modification methylase domain-containing protein [Nanoarchaeota archaeon]